MKPTKRPTRPRKGETIAPRPRWLRKGARVTLTLAAEVTCVMDNGWVWLLIDRIDCQEVFQESSRRVAVRDTVLGKTWNRAPARSAKRGRHAK
jgi:hypothetical protein